MGSVFFLFRLARRHYWKTQQLKHTQTVFGRKGKEKAKQAKTPKSSKKNENTERKKSLLEEIAELANPTPKRN